MRNYFETYEEAKKTLLSILPTIFTQCDRLNSIGISVDKEGYYFNAGCSSNREECCYEFESSSVINESFSARLLDQLPINIEEKKLGLRASKKEESTRSNDLPYPKIPTVIKPGMDISNGVGDKGTLTIFAIDKEANPYVLCCTHILEYLSDRTVCQPAVHYNYKSVPIGRVLRNACEIGYDASIADLKQLNGNGHKTKRTISNKIWKLGKTPTLVGSPALGQKVEKYGQGTKKRSIGIVAVTDLFWRGKKGAFFQIDPILDDESFAVQLDSGSLVITTEEGYVGAVGMLAEELEIGERNVSSGLAIPLKPLFEHFKVELYK